MTALNYGDRIKELNKALKTKVNETSKKTLAEVAGREAALRQARIAPLIERVFAKFDVELAAGNVSMAKLYLSQSRRLNALIAGKRSGSREQAVRATSIAVRHLGVLIGNGFTTRLDAVNCALQYRRCVLGHRVSNWVSVDFGRSLPEFEKRGFSFQIS